MIVLTIKQELMGLLKLEKKYNMNKEQIIDEVYNKYLVYTIEGVKNGFDRIKGYLDNCLVEYDGYYEHFTNPSFAYGYRTYNQEEFINKCKIDTEFSEKWGLKIEERELSLEERMGLCKEKWDYSWNRTINLEDIEWRMNNEWNIPTKLITLTYNNKTIESYE